MTGAPPIEPDGRRWANDLSSRTNDQAFGRAP
jgi:hypothetical protein